MNHVASFPIEAASVFGAGLLASLSPCVYPMIPITVSFLGSKQMGSRKSNVVLFALGQAATFAVLGLVATRLGEVLGFTSESRAVNLGIGCMMLVLGVLSFQKDLPGFFRKWNEKTTSIEAKVTAPQSRIKSSFNCLSAFAVGVGAALIASPCTSPILGSVLATVAKAETALRGTLLMAIYGFGATVVFVVLGLGLVKARGLPRSGLWLERSHQLGGALVFAAAGYYFYRAAL